MKKYIMPMMNVKEFDIENIVTDSVIIPEPETVAAADLINGTVAEKSYTETVTFTF